MSTSGNEAPFNYPTNNDDLESDTKSPYPIAKRARKSKKYLWLGLIILALGALIYGGIKLVNAKKSSRTKATNQISRPAIDTSASNQDVPNTDKTTSYENGFLGIKLTYPSTWTATESANKDSVRFESPRFSYKTLDQRNITGNFRIYIRKGARDIDGKYIGRGVALQASEKLAYKQPAPGQRTDTNLTLFGLDTPDNFALFLIAGNYSLNKGDTLGPNYGKEPETYIIAGGYSSKELADDLATNQVAPDILASSNAYKQALELLKSLQLR